MENLYLYIGTAVVLLVLFLRNNKRNKTIKKVRGNRSFKERFNERKRNEKGIDDKM
jgi:hypothetical protein